MRAARTVEPNPGTRRSFEKKISALIKRFNDDIRDDIFEHLISSGLAQDASLTNPRSPEARRKLHALMAKISRTIGRRPDRLRGKIEEFVNANIGRWMTKVTDEAREICVWYVQNCAYEVSSAQRRAFVTAGISPEVFRQRWKIPTVKRRYLSRNAQAELPNLVRGATELITRFAADDLARTQQVITESVLGGKSYADIETTLKAAKGFDDARAKRVALDQSLKVTSGVQIANCASLGIKKGVWIHVPGQYTSRDTHIAMNGKEYDISKGLYDSDVGRYVVPAELPYCRCLCRPLIPPELLGK